MYVQTEDKKNIDFLLFSMGGSERTPGQLRSSKMRTATEG